MSIESNEQHSADVGDTQPRSATEPSHAAVPEPAHAAVPEPAESPDASPLADPIASPPAAQLETPWPNSSSEWQRVSPKYAWADLVGSLLFALIPAGVFVFVWVLNSGDVPLIATIVLAAGTGFLVLLGALSFRRVRAIGYILREDDLLFRRGIMFERVIAVPYGRLQLVDVSRDPVLRALGLSTLKFVTASAATGVQLPGLVASDAEQLRDRLVELAETRRAGL